MKSYQEALSHYNSIKKPPRAKYWTTGAGTVNNGKPLRRTSEGHMGIHMRDDGAIYYRLYDTRIALFYPPDTDGTERKVFKYVGTQTTGTFMQEYGLQFYYVTMEDGTEAQIPYVSNGTWAENDKVTADLIFNAEGQVIRARSAHKDVYTMVSNDDDKAKRKELRDKVEHLITLSLFKLPQLKEDATVEESWGQPFGTSYRNAPREVEHLKQYLGNHELDINDERFISMFMESLQSAFNLYASKVCYDAGLFVWGRFWDIPDQAQREEAARKHKIDQQEQRFAKVADIDEKAFKKSLTNMLLSACNIKTGSVKKPWGQFMPKLPRKWLA
jgi:hypothetical protein